TFLTGVGADNGQGLRLDTNANVASTGAGNISLTGTGGTVDGSGVVISTGTTVNSSAGGAITISGNARSGFSGSIGAQVDGSVLANSGNIQITSNFGGG